MKGLMNENGREATFEERATWGICPVCGANPGEFCYADVGVQMGRTVGGDRMKDGDGAHLRRLQKAPVRIKIVGC